ncbi:hypothetical protein RVS70_08865 [Virgibacillus sp. M23]|uniref:hypothetical protein n=1 Tax=Virgibacillus sp. M23 TaxID=3079030 RepID=UPI002A91C7DB|nr:hypothetical protein [Virgibacillus sp. M23]MDY7044314.1 hypothetical protein [Virgibacillus sp. M23]
MQNSLKNGRSIDFNNESLSTIGYSGNSDVDVEVIVDTTPIAYAMLCTLLTTKQISDNEFSAAVRKLEDLTHRNKHHSTRELNDLSQVKLNKKRLRRYN